MLLDGVLGGVSQATDSEREGLWGSRLGNHTCEGGSGARLAREGGLGCSCNRGLSPSPGELWWPRRVVLN